MKRSFFIHFLKHSRRWRRAAEAPELGSRAPRAARKPDASRGASGASFSCGLGLSRCRRRRPPQAARAVVRDHSGRGRRERPKFQEPPSSAATVQNLRRPRRHNPRRLVARPAAHHRFCSFKSEQKKPQPTLRHCRLTGLNHALTYSNLAPISWRSEK